MMNCFKHTGLQLFHGAALAVLLAGSAAAQEPAIAPVSDAAQIAAQTLAYWTPERMRAAIPKDMPSAEATARFAVQSATSARAPDAYPAVMPGWNPNSGLPQPTIQSLRVFGPGTPEYQRAMSANQPALVFGSAPANPLDYDNYGRFQRWTWYGQYIAYPTSTIVKMFFSQNGSGFVCSGTVINRSVILTAGHCVSTGAGVWSTNVLFCPSYNLAQGVNPQRGCWASTGYMATTSDWHTGSDFDRDYACAVTQASGSLINNRIGNVTGWVGWAVNFARNQQVFSTGYPQGAPFHGSHIIFTAASEWYSSNRGGDAHVSKYIGNDMTGGSSGGSWWLSIRHESAERPDVDGSNITDPGAPNGPFANGLNSHKRCLSSCFTPPTSSAGTFWAEMGSPDFTSSDSDNRDVLDILTLCGNNGGS